MRAVVRRALGTRRLGPAVCFTVAAGTLSVRARSADIAVEHRLPTDAADETLWLPFEFLDDCSGKRDEPVRVEATGKGRVTAQWRDGSVPQIVQYDSAVPPDADKFPSPPETSTENPAGLLKALDDARDTTDPSPTRFAMDCVQWRGATGSLAASDGRHLLVQSGYQFPWQDDLLIPGSKVFGSPELPQDAPVRVGKSGNWVAIAVAPWTIYLAVNVDGRFHAGLEGFYRHRQLGVTLEADDVAERMLRSWAQLVDEEKMAFDSPEAEQAMRQQAADLVRAYLAYAPTFEKPLAVEVAAEAPLVDPVTGEDLGMPLVGIIDLVLDYEEGPLIADFKTAARSSEPMEITHEIQLSSYAYLFRQASRWPESRMEIRSLIKTKSPKIEFHSYPARTEAHFRRLFAVIHEYLDALDTGRFNYRPGFGCGICDYRERCSKWAG
jgi:hypothetical protein